MSNPVHFILLYHHFRFFLLSDSYNLFAYAHETACNTDVFKIVSIQSFIYLLFCLIKILPKTFITNNILGQIRFLYNNDARKVQTAPTWKVTIKHIDYTITIPWPTRDFSGLSTNWKLKEKISFFEREVQLLSYIKTN